MGRYSIRRDVLDHVGDLEDYLREQNPSDDLPNEHQGVLDVAIELRRAVEAGDLDHARSLTIRLHHDATDSLRWTDRLLRCVNFLHKYVPILAANHRCPYCNGNLRSAHARQCPECLRDWHEG